MCLEAGEREKKNGAPGSGQVEQDCGAVEKVTNPGSMDGKTKENDFSSFFRDRALLS